MSYEVVFFDSGGTIYGFDGEVEIDAGPTPPCVIACS